jgi:hypothetical protein
MLWGTHQARECYDHKHFSGNSQLHFPTGTCDCTHVACSSTAAYLVDGKHTRPCTVLLPGLCLTWLQPGTVVRQQCVRQLRSRHSITRRQLG